jgi:hypothetical protein
VQRSAAIDADLSKFRVFGENVAAMTDEISGISEPVERANQVCGVVVDKVAELDRMAQENAAKLANTSEKFDQLVSVLRRHGPAGRGKRYRNPDTPIIRACIAQRKKPRGCSRQPSMPARSRCRPCSTTTIARFPVPSPSRS